MLRLQRLKDGSAVHPQLRSSRLPSEANLISHINSIHFPKLPRDSDRAGLCLTCLFNESLAESAESGPVGSQILSSSLDPTWFDHPQCLVDGHPNVPIDLTFLRTTDLTRSPRSGRGIARLTRNERKRVWSASQSRIIDR